MLNTTNFYNVKETLGQQKDLKKKEFTSTMVKGYGNARTQLPLPTQERKIW